MDMCSVWSLVFFGIMPAANVDCKVSCTRSKSQADKGETTRAESPVCTAVIWSLCRKSMQLWACPPKHFIWKATAKVVSSCFRGGAGGENFPLFLYSNISNILQVDLFTVGVQMFLVHAFLLKGDEATRRISWDLQNSIFMQISWSFVTFHPDLR